MGRSRGRARRRIDKAFSPGASRGFAGANMTAQPKTYGLAEAINAATNGGWGIGQMRDMMRDPRDDVAFGPSNPLAPAPIDPLRPDTKRPEPRLTEYPVAWNLPGNSDRLTPWSTLRAAAASVDIMRRCISVRKEQLQGLEWAIGLDDAAVQGIIAEGDGSQGRTDIEADLRRSLLPEIRRLTEFWCNPWKANGLSFEQWVNGIMEDHLVLDAVAVYPRMTYGGDVSAFELIDATTIKLLIDYRGARPMPPYPAFQQVLYGFPRGEFASAARMETDEEGNVIELVEPGIPADQLWYFREEYRSFTPYGYSAVEQSLISARLYLKRQGWMLAEYDDGSTPLTWLVPDSSDGSMAEKLTFRTRRQWEDSLNDELAGQTRARHRMKVAPPGMNPVQMAGVDERYKPDYDMHLIKMLAGHFGVTSSGLGFSESKGLGNSGLHEGQADVQDASTTKPDTRMIERIVNELSRTYLKMPPELRFKFVSQDVEDQAAEDVARNSQRARGTITLNDDRKAIGKTPFTFPEADMPMVLVGNAWVPLEGMAERAEQAAAQEAALVESQLAVTATESAVDGEEVAAEDAEKALELSAYRRWARKRGGDARRPFICKALEPTDFPGGDVPADVDFSDWVWIPEGFEDETSIEDIEKAFGGNDNWRTMARDHRGRWVKRGSMRIAPLGPSAPDKPVLAGLAQDASRRRRLAEIKASQAAKRAAVEASRPRTDQDVARRIAGSGIVISRRLKEMPAAAKLNPPSNAEGVKAGGIGPDGTVTDDMGREVGRLHPNVTAEQVEAGGWLRVETGVPGASGGFRTISVWKEPSERQLPVSDASSTMDGMTTPTNLPPNPAIKTREQRVAELNAGMAAAMSGGAPAKGSMAERIMARQDASVRDVVTSLQDAPGGWVAMADVRRKLAAEHGMDRGQQDAALRRLATTGDRSLNTAPEDNQKTLTDADHAAAVDFGAGPQHVISLDPPRRSVLDTMRESSEQAAAASAVIDSVPGLREGVARQQPRAQRRFDDGPLTSSADDPELSTVREATPTPGFAIPATPPAAEMSKTQRTVAESFDRVAGEFGADPEVAQWRARALDVAGDMDTARGDARVTAQLKAGEIQREFSYAMAGARAAKEARETGGNENAARVDAAESARLAYLDREIARRERQIRDYSGETRKTLRGQLNEVKAQRKAAADRIEAAKPTPAARAEAVAASTPDAPNAAPARRDPAELTGQAYRSLLATVGEGGRITHPQSRKIVETMERGGWKLADVKPGISEWKHEDGRRITMLSGADKPTFMADGRKLTGKAALEHVESDHRVTQAAMERVRSVKGLDAQMDAVDAELERPGLREHTRRELEALRAKGEAIRAARAPQETPEARMERVKAEVAQRAAERKASAQREVARAVEYVGDVMPKTRLDGAALATRLGLEMFNVQSRPDGTFTFALSAPGQPGSARLATFDSARGGWILPGLGGYTFDANDPEFMAVWLHEGTKASHLNDNTKRAHKVSELLREARR